MKDDIEVVAVYDPATKDVAWKITLPGTGEKLTLTGMQMVKLMWRVETTMRAASTRRVKP